MWQIIRDFVAGAVVFFLTTQYLEGHLLHMLPFRG